MKHSNEIHYSEKYEDDKYEYRQFKEVEFSCESTDPFLHVNLPPELAKIVPKTHLMTETEWRNLGVQQSPGWVHYLLHSPEPHILLFRRPKPTKSTTS